jgi:uncharacterized protein YdhG (YjbR/CyaY superfamily)
MTKPIASIDDYLATLPDAARSVVEELRRTIHRACPGAGEAIRYRMPTFTLDGGSLVHLAAWKNHVGLYPLPPLDGDLAVEVEPYRGAKDAMHLPLRAPVPYELVGRVVAVLADRHRAYARVRDAERARPRSAD